MNKQWILQLAGDIGNKYGKETCDRIFGNIDSMENSPESISAWFNSFSKGLDDLNDKTFLQQMMANHCPCGGNYEIDGRAMKDIYERSNTLTEFVDALKKWNIDKYGDYDIVELRDNVLFMTKPLGESTGTGSCGKGCHCWLAMHTNKTVSDIFCHCCTIGHTGRPFKVAFGDDIEMKFIESIICGGKACVMAVQIPEKR
jgi:hypothetical protein